MTKQALFKVIFVVYMLAVLFLCFAELGSFNNVRKEIFNIPVDKMVHFLMFFPFPILAYVSFGRFTKSPLHSLLLSLGLFIIGFLIAIGTEAVQEFLKYRTGDAKDLMADGLALGISSIIVLIADLRKQFTT